VWERTINGRVLTFRLFGINNQNFIMRDSETGSWWQQVTGEAIHGPLKGSRLVQVVHDEVSFGIWRGEEPQGRVLRPVKEVEAEYADWNWEKRMKKARTVVAKAKGDLLEPRAVIVGVVRNGQARAYPFPRLKAQNPVVDKLGGEPIVVVVGDDKKSVRVFKAQAGERPLSLLRKSEPGPLRLVDAETGSEWDFTGTAVAGPLAGSRLEKLFALKEYWFDWKIYNPRTSVYTLGPASAN
jgi:Protein of unknown function (DUF3179)